MLINRDPYRKEQGGGLLGIISLPYFFFEGAVIPFVRTQYGRYYFNPELAGMGMICMLVVGFILNPVYFLIWLFLWFVMSIYSRLKRRGKVGKVHVKYVGDSILFLILSKFKFMSFDDDIDFSDKHHTFRDYYEPFVYAAIFWILSFIFSIAKGLPTFCMIWGGLSVLYSIAYNSEQHSLDVRAADQEIERQDALARMKKKGFKTPLDEIGDDKGNNDDDDEASIAS